MLYTFEKKSLILLMNILYAIDNVSRYIDSLFFNHNSYFEMEKKEDRWCSKGFFIYC